MKTRRLLLLFILIIATSSAFPQIAPQKYVAWLSNKANNPYSLSNPSEFLSQRALDRRARYNIPLDERDLPVTPQYIEQIAQVGVQVLNASKWLNFVVFQTEDPLLVEQVEQLEFVSKVEKMKRKTHIIQPVNKILFENYYPMSNEINGRSMSLHSKSSNMAYDLNYGEAYTQIHMVKGDELHKMGYQGHEMMIALLDAGFNSVNVNPAFDSLWIQGRILGYRDIVQYGNDIFSQNISPHGAYVLSIMGANLPGQMVGTAPHALYYLIRTEDDASEYVIEEYNWVTGAELADSIGADIINSSLGYTTFDDPSQNHTYVDMDGNTAISTRGADIAAIKGMIVVNSAGNSGSSTWHYIGAPADGDSVFSIGAVDRWGYYASFSSTGPTYDGRIKPNVAAMGQGTAVVDVYGNVTYGSGTSFSSPLIAGCMACLWQAHLNNNNMSLMNAVMETASQSHQPDSLLGYGIPDFLAASQTLSVGENELPIHDRFIVYPTIFFDKLMIKNEMRTNEYITVSLLNTQGKLLQQKVFNGYHTYFYLTEQLRELKSGLYILQISYPSGFNAFKLIKQ
ncbi:MAG TPA: S8 family serine peptidase [Bacteroidales bacterium]|nr:S8 family serine peptidase [Bacteroidales bacterium]